jgi:hypothetical protein
MYLKLNGQLLNLILSVVPSDIDGFIDIQYISRQQIRSLKRIYKSCVTFLFEDNAHTSRKIDMDPEYGR